LDIPNCKLQTALPLSNYIHILTPKEDRKKHNYLYFSRISQICRSGGCYIYIIFIYTLHVRTGKWHTPTRGRVRCKVTIHAFWTKNIKKTSHKTSSTWFILVLCN
jgi:hypothetical protein